MKKWREATSVGLALLLIVAAMLLPGCCKPEEEIAGGAQAYQTGVYFDSGGDKLIVASGGEIEVQSGATLDVQSGATTDYSGGVDLDGALLDFDADGNTSMQADTNNQIDIEINGADDFKFTANTFTALAGSSLAANTIAETTAATGVTIDGLTLKDGGVQDSGGLDVVGIADTQQLVLTGYATQTNHILVVEANGGSDLFWVDNNGDVEMNGTTPTLTMGDAGEEDSAIVFDGNAQDFYIGLDDTADDLVFGKGSALGTTQAFGIDENLVTTWAGGTILLAETHTTTDTLTAAECGKTVFLNTADGIQITLPAISTVSAGCEFRFIVKTAPTTDAVIITGNSTEDVLVGGINELEVDTGDDGPYDANADTLTFVASTAVVGDYVYMISDGAMFYVSGQANADGGVTITDSD